MASLPAVLELEETALLWGERLGLAKACHWLAVNGHEDLGRAMRVAMLGETEGVLSVPLMRRLEAARKALAGTGKGETVSIPTGIDGA